MAAPTFSCCDLALRNFPGAADLAAALILLIELSCKKMQLPLIVINTVVAFVNATTIIITILVLKVQHHQQHYYDPMDNHNDHLHLSGCLRGQIQTDP